MLEIPFDAARRYVGPETEKGASALVSEPGHKTARALDTSIAAMFAGFINESSDESSLTRLHGMFTAAAGDGDRLDRLPDILADRQRAGQHAQKGHELLGSLFRGRLPQVTDHVATTAGVSRASARGILALAAPVAAWVIGREVVSQRLGPAELRRLLLGQENAVKAVLGPTGTKLFFDDVALVDRDARLPRAAKARARHLAPSDAVVERRAAHVVTEREPRDRSRTGLWIALGALGLVGLLGLFGSGEEKVLGAPRVTPPELPQMDMAPPTLPLPPVLMPTLEAPKSLPAPEVPAAKPAETATLPVVVSGFAFNEDAAPQGADLEAAADRVAALLKANPNARIRIDGYTDDRGNDALNQDLSLRRAMEFRTLLFERGVERGAIAIAGRGASRPLAPNTTDEGRAQNRRIEIVATHR